MDDASRANIEALKNKANEILENNAEKIDKIIDILNDNS